ncbi:hypothetical protein TKK_0002182 [Trichogramma kaykai]
MDPQQFVHPLEDQPYDVRNAEPVELELNRPHHDDRRKRRPTIGRDPEPRDSPCIKSPPTCCKQEEPEQPAKGVCCNGPKVIKCKKERNLTVRCGFKRKRSKPRCSLPIVIPRELLGREEHQDLLATPKQRDSPCATCCEVRRVKPTSARTEQLAKPMARRVRETLKQKMDILPLRKLENLVNQLDIASSGVYGGPTVRDAAVDPNLGHRLQKHPCDRQSALCISPSSWQIVVTATGS